MIADNATNSFNDDIQVSDGFEGSKSVTETASISQWACLIVIACISFWAQALVTEERFVPALNHIATRFNIPNDVAGATLMAAGASSPELFSSIVSLFITHSSLGLGTIVGSEIFNQLIICAGAVFAAKSGQLILDRVVLIREVSFYGLSIVLLYVALQDTGTLPEDPTGENHIFISFHEACMVFGGYLAYVWVCANMERITAFFSGAMKKEADQASLKNNSEMKGYGTCKTTTHTSFGERFGDGSLPFLQEASLLDDQPAGNFKKATYSKTVTGDRSARYHDAESNSMESQDSHDFDSNDDEVQKGKHQLEKKQRSFLSNSYLKARSSQESFTFSFRGHSIRPFEFLVRSEKPSDDRSMYSVELNLAQNRLSCFMWQRSYFYTNARFATQGWNLRWFTLTQDRVWSVPDRTQTGGHSVEYPMWKSLEVDDNRLIIRTIPQSSKTRSFYFMAPNMSILEQVVKKMEDIMESHAASTKEAESVASTQPLLLSEPHSGVDQEKGDDEYGEDDNFASLIEFPVDGSNLEIIFFCLLFPFRLLMHWTVPDVRKLDEQGMPVTSLRTAFLAVLGCLLWLIVMSYAMVTSLEDLAELLAVPDAIVGVTVSAAGTSLPNYVASKVAAEKGFGNMAVSNAFGSNTFNIMVGLGLPWVMYTSFGTNFQPYSGLKDEGITESVAVLGSVWLIFIVMVVPFGFTLHKWHGIVFVLMYIAYLLYCVGQLNWW